MENFYDFDVANDVLEVEKTYSAKKENSFVNTVVFDTKNYLNVRLEPNEVSRTIRFRLLPYPETKNPFLHIHMHTIKVPKEISESGWKSYVCFEKTEGLDEEKYGKRCPFCEKARKLFTEAKAETDPQMKEELRAKAKSYLPSEVVIMRGIERSKEDEGVKFWKTKVHNDKGDPYNLIKTLADTRKQEWLADPDNEGKNPAEANILSINSYGYDLQITIKKETKNGKNGKSVETMSYQVTDAKKPSPLSTDIEQAKKWVYDPKKWFEVFVPKPYEYLSIVMDGELPWFDRDSGKWISRKEKEQNDEIEIGKANEEIRKAEEISISALSSTQYANKPQDRKQETTPEDELPF